MNESVYQVSSSFWYGKLTLYSLIQDPLSRQRISSGYHLNNEDFRRGRQLLIEPLDFIDSFDPPTDWLPNSDRTSI